MQKRKALIVGAGPAGLTAAFEFVKRSDIQPIVLEKSEYMGGISRTVRYKGNRIDIGGHRFFSKSDRVMKWWTAVMPVEGSSNGSHQITYHQQSREVAAPAVAVDPADQDRVMLIRNRKSRIYFLRQFFDYPIKLSADTLKKLGLIRTVRIGISYSASVVNQKQPEKTLEQFLINRFGRQLYLTFFKSYTEKVWGVPCDQISAEWGAQRIKGLSIAKAILHFLKKAASREATLSQKNTETSLIEKFLYPKFGPGQLWENVAQMVTDRGGAIETGWSAEKLCVESGRIPAVEAIRDDGTRRTFPADYVFSTMPMKELVQALDTAVPDSVRQVSDGLIYRDFITVGMLLRKLTIKEKDEAGARLLKDNWIYVQEPDVLVGRIQIFNNWSPYMVADPGTVWMGL